MHLATMLVAAAIAAGPLDGEHATLNHPVGEIRPYAVDSGQKANGAEIPIAVFTQEVTVEGAAWMRLYFAEVELGPGSTIRMTSLLDGEVQELDAEGMAMWGNTSAYFNGGTVHVELNAAPKTSNHFTITDVAVEIANVQPVGASGQCGICGGTDNRQPSSELWTGRLFPAGCTASVIAPDSCLVSAGHCIGGGMVIQFNVPPSQANCNTVNPPVADQFPCFVSAFNNNGPGDDWSVLTSGTNNLGQRPFDRYGQLKEVSTVPATAGQTTRITGYGVDLTCTLSQTQQTSTGPICTVQNTLYTFQVDLRGGNSGSSLIRESDQTVIGIATHCPCCNIATRVTNSDFNAAIAAACSLAPPVNNACAAPLALTLLSTPFNSFGATTDGPELPPECDEGAGLSFENDVWYTYVATCTGTAFINTCFAASFNARMAAYVDNCGSLTLIDCSDNSCGDDPSLQFPISCGNTYVIRLGANGDTAGSGTIFTSCLGDCAPPCPWDLDGNGSVDTVDFLDLLGAWGPNPGHPADFNSDGVVDTVDFLELLANWGPCPA